MSIKGTIFSRHIEEPEKPFLIEVLRAPCFNVLYKPERLEVWRVLAQTTEGALKIAQYHFHRSNPETIKAI